MIYIYVIWYMIRYMIWYIIWYDIIIIIYLTANGLSLDGSVYNACTISNIIHRKFCKDFDAMEGMSLSLLVKQPEYEGHHSVLFSGDIIYDWNFYGQSPYT